MLREGPLQALHLHDKQLPLLRDSLAEVAAQQAHIQALPRANLHADLFRDNLMFDGPHLSGVIDFYNACAGAMLYDVAISVNDWCSERNGRLNGSSNASWPVCPNHKNSNDFFAVVVTNECLSLIAKEASQQRLWH